MGNNFWGDNNFLVTGGVGFVGSHLVKEMRKKGAREIKVLRAKL